ncbi:hypothetical protein N7495_004668 [Penicillium taxi]|uniref:uncharacterized protein n=1 Tax=Penicillium taxi TaxID=168475 RepID=UPI002545AE54|nr:uncharacterized protein N7495_004668 [Penicillium taxi]KAJ5899924.1 hypothetical protein N7495_004668 [Penicillium taxi]
MDHDIRYFNGITREDFGSVPQHGNLTHSAFIDMMKFIIPSNTPAELTIVAREDGAHVLATRQLIVAGDYDIFPAEGSTIKLTDEVRDRRIPSRNNTGATPHVVAFCTAVRKRDKMCVLSGRVNTSANRPPAKQNWARYQAAHIFPLARSSYWRENNFNRYITNLSGGAHRAYINSVQNGLCMRSDLHTAFDNNDISINPDDSYKIYDFTDNDDGIDGRVLPLVCRTRGDPNAVSNDLLRWHWQQTLLKNLKGTAEPIWEFDFPDGTDMIGEILAGPEPAERMEAELLAYLYEYVSDGPETEERREAELFVRHHEYVDDESDY